jgi:hypothetical protein
MTKQTNKSRARKPAHVDIATAESVARKLDNKLGQVEIFEQPDDTATMRIIPGASFASIDDALWDFGLRVGADVPGDEFNRVYVVKATRRAKRVSAVVAPAKATKPKCPSCEASFDGERCFECRYIAPDAKPWQPAPHASSVEASCPVCSRTNAMLSSYDSTVHRIVIRCRDCDYAPNDPNVEPPWRFTRYYRGSVSGSTIVRCALDDFRTLHFAADYEGTGGWMRHMDAKRLGEIIVTDWRSETVARFSRAEALAAESIGRFFAAAAQIERAPEWYELPWSCGHNDPIFRGVHSQECATCGAWRCAPGIETEIEPKSIEIMTLDTSGDVVQVASVPVAAKPEPARSCCLRAIEQLNAALQREPQLVERIEIKRGCAAQCGATLTYEVIAEDPNAMPEVVLKAGGYYAFGAGHLCNECSTRVLAATKAVR